MKYSEFHYERISVEEQSELLNERLERFNNAASADEQIAVIKEVERTRKQIYSYFAIADLAGRRGRGEVIDWKQEKAIARRQLSHQIISHRVTINVVIREPSTK